MMDEQEAQERWVTAMRTVFERFGMAVTETACAVQTNDPLTFQARESMRAEWRHLADSVIALMECSK